MANIKAALDAMDAASSAETCASCKIKDDKIAALRAEAVRLKGLLAQSEVVRRENKHLTTALDRAQNLARLASEAPGFARYLTAEWSKRSANHRKAINKADPALAAMVGAKAAALEAAHVLLAHVPSEVRRVMRALLRRGAFDSYKDAECDALLECVHQADDDAGVRAPIREAIAAVHDFTEGLKCLEHGLSGGLWGEVDFAKWHFEQASLVWKRRKAPAPAAP